MRIVSRLAVYLVAVGAATAAELPVPIFYLSFEDTTAAAPAGGSARPRLVSQEDPILALADLGIDRFVEGQVGRAYDATAAPLLFRSRGNFRADEGTCSFWLNPGFRGDDTHLYCTFFGVADWGMLYKYREHTSITFGTAKPDRDLYYDCNVADIRSWRPGQWHHLAASWSRQQNRRRIYVDGALAAQAPFPFHRPVVDGPLFVGSGCTLYPGYTAQGCLDEFAIWDRALDDAEVAEVCKRGSAGLRLVDPQPTGPTAAGQPPLPAAVPGTVPDPEPSEEPVSATRSRTRLDGWWCFQPADAPLAVLPSSGWGRTTVPGYWTTPGTTVTAAGQPVTSQWAGQPLASYPVAYYRRAFQPPPVTGDQRLLLFCDGVEGLGELCLNGRFLAWLPPWEPAWFDLTSAVAAGPQNELCVALHSRSSSGRSGIYGSVSLLRVGRAVVLDVLAQPKVSAQRLRLSTRVWSGQNNAVAACLAFDVTPESDGAATGQHFEHAFSLTAPSPADRGDLHDQAQEVVADFAWPEARPWTHDAPFCYRLRTRLLVGGTLVDAGPDVRFGCRDFQIRGGDFLLNGVPTHLRGHQIDLGWPDQFARVKELKSAGMNSFEFSGPIRSSWYEPTPYQAALFEGILDYADTHGLIALPALPDARELRDRISEPAVARLYQRRVEKHIRRFGNHPSVCMWFMSFNLAGYNWYNAPGKVDGSYKPDDPEFQRKERYCLAAQRLAQEGDDRPIYHHACGNFGDVFTLNCYIGPSSPLQEREEWPSRWAASKSMPLLACEHCLWLIPYWFRPRQFPLSIVYAGEPIFDELAALRLGQRAYGLVTPELFELYDIGRKPRPERTRSLIRAHPGYQDVKAGLARYSLRSWRTYGVSGMLFNAINWDFLDAAGNPLPVQRALARYFADTDLYIAGPGQDWPAKDHCFVSGEVISKQFVLINDLSRTLPAPLRWQFVDAAGQAQAAAEVQAEAGPGVPTFVPVSVVAPRVERRSEFRLVVEGTGPAAAPFPPDSFQITVFPPAPPVPLGGIVLHDPAGETRDLLARLGVTALALAPDTDLTQARLLVVGRRALTPDFLALAGKTRLEAAVNRGLNLLVFEQDAPILGLRLAECSTRTVFPTAGPHPLTHGLEPSDFQDLRGQSDMVDAYPEPGPETRRQWPVRYFKWGNRGVTATYVFRKPHLAPFVPVLESGFDLCDSPLLEARFGRGLVVLCQVDVTRRYAQGDPVSVRLVNNLLAWLTQPAAPEPPTCAVVGAAARQFLSPFGLMTADLAAATAGPGLVVAVDGGLTAVQATEVREFASQGATVLLLPGLGPEQANWFDLTTEKRKLFGGRVRAHELLRGIGDGDVYLKAWAELDCVRPDAGWSILVEPGLLALRPEGRGRLIACRLPIDALGQTRGRIKALRFWNLLLANLRLRRDGDATFLTPAASPYAENEWEQMPPYINW